MAWYHYDGIAEEFLRRPNNHATTLDVIAWFDDAPDEWDWLAYETQLRAYRKQKAMVADLLDELMQAPEFGYAEVGERVPKRWAPWIGMLLMSEMPHTSRTGSGCRGATGRRRRDDALGFC